MRIRYFTQIDLRRSASLATFAVKFDKNSSFKSSQLRQGELWVNETSIFVISGVDLVG